MATTTPYGFNYPLNSGFVNVAGDIQQLAEDVNNKLQTDFPELGTANVFTNNNTFADITVDSITVAGETGYLKADGTVENGTFLTGSTTISLTGDASGSGALSSSISLTLANSGVTAGTYKSVTVDAKGRVTAGTNPTTLSGYGITDAASSSHTHAFADITSKPTTLSGYGITDAQPADSDLTAIAGLTGAGVATRASDGSWSLGTAYTGISFSGDVTGSASGGTGSLTLATIAGLTAGTYNGITVNTKGLVTSVSTTDEGEFSNVKLGHTADTYAAAAARAIDFLQGFRSITTSTNQYFTITNAAVGRSVAVRVINSTASAITLTTGTSGTTTFPSAWTFVGTKPTSLAANKTAILSLTAFGTTDADIVAAWAVQA